MARAAYSIDLTTRGRRGAPTRIDNTLVFRELVPSELVDAFKFVGRGTSEVTLNREGALQGLTWCLRRIGERELNDFTAREKAVKEALRLNRHFDQAIQGWSDVNIPEPGAVDAVLKTLLEGDEPETWTVTLPGRLAIEAGAPDMPERVITLKEQPTTQVDALLRQAEASAKSPLAQVFAAAIEGGRASVIAIDGKPVSLSAADWDTHFTVYETWLLNQVYADLNGGGEEAGKAVRLA